MNHRNNDTIIIQHCRGNIIKKCVIFVNNVKNDVKIDFKIGDIIEIKNTTIDSFLMIFDQDNNLVFYGNV